MYGRPRDPAVNICQKGRSGICLVLGSPRHFVQILQKLFAIIYNLKNFAQISIIA
jgi:hypothetical protein